MFGVVTFGCAMFLLVVGAIERNAVAFFAGWGLLSLYFDFALKHQEKGGRHG